MSLHITNPELEARLAAQRRNSTIASIIVGLLLMTLLALIFYFIGIKLFTDKVEPIVTYASDEPSEEVVEKVKVTNSVKKKPSSPSSSAVKVITSVAVSDVSIPTPEIAVDNLSVDFGESEGFGDGWGGAGGGFGSGGGGGAFSFMGSKMSGDKVCFVIDYSASMRGEKIRLLKAELEKTISTFPEKAEFQLIFFAGPAWVAGDQINSNQKTGIITTEKGQKYDWRNTGGNNWVREGRKQPIPWMKSSRATREKALKHIQETGLIWGTTWTEPLAMALEMSPEPDTIVFLTDGSSGKNSLEIAKEAGQRAKKAGIVVNTIALMQPQAREAMAELARLSGGEFSLIDETGKKVNQGKGGGKGGIKKR